MVNSRYFEEEEDFVEVTHIAIPHRMESIFPNDGFVVRKVTLARTAFSTQTQPENSHAKAGVRLPPRLLLQTPPGVGLRGPSRRGRVRLAGSPGSLLAGGGHRRLGAEEGALRLPLHRHGAAPVHQIQGGGVILLPRCLYVQCMMDWQGSLMLFT